MVLRNPVVNIHYEISRLICCLSANHMPDRNISAILQALVTPYLPGSLCDVAMELLPLLMGGSPSPRLGGSVVSSGQAFFHVAMLLRSG